MTKQLDEIDRKMLDDFLAEMRSIGEEKYADEDWILSISAEYETGCYEYSVSYGRIEIAKHEGHFEKFEYWPDPESDIFIERQDYEQD